MTTIAINGLSEEEFRRSIESGLRRGRAGESVEKLRELIAPFAGPGKVLPERFLTVEASDLVIRGWENLGDHVRKHDRPGRPVTALTIAFGWPGEDVPQPDESGRLSPLVEVGYYNDDSYPFSRSGREDLLDGYSLHGCTWADDSAGSDTALLLEGISDLHGALALLEARLLACEEPDPDEICAGSLGSCLLSALLYQAVSAKVAQEGLPRPLCVMAGSNGVYPYFDAPVTGMPVEVLKAAKAEDEDEGPVDAGVPGPRYSSLLLTGIRRAPKRAVLVLQESEEEMAVRIAHLRGLNHGSDEAPAPVPTQTDLPPPEVPRAEDESITDSPISPLMTKKHASHGWDFRDMLGPREDHEANGADADAAPSTATDFSDWEDFDPLDSSFDAEAEVAETESSLGQFEEPFDLTDPAWPEIESHEADLADQTAPAEVVEPVAQEPAEPGFSLIDPADPVAITLEQRLQSLIADPLRTEVPETEDIDELALTDDQMLEPADPPVIPEVTVPHWPLGLGWLETETDPEPTPEPRIAEIELPEIEPEPVLLRPGLWERFRAWLGPIRRPAPPPGRSRRIRP
ncbi:hypothetical protein [Novosphingobium sp.]|uniref:hypothetical protein n=1 Tax=Novosphingobium sp. TaxID=1874826 RepID=UPI0025EC3158|nr:hypothetical protein [Novosphingobium sp.]MCC6927198.1 hypothetical protein [Novosphingobium sp.]